MRDPDVVAHVEAGVGEAEVRRPHPLGDLRRQIRGRVEAVRELERRLWSGQRVPVEQGLGQPVIAIAGHRHHFAVADRCAQQLQEGRPPFENLPDWPVAELEDVTEQDDPVGGRELVEQGHAELGVTYQVGADQGPEVQIGDDCRSDRTLTLNTVRTGRQRGAVEMGLRGRRSLAIVLHLVEMLLCVGRAGIRSWRRKEVAGREVPRAGLKDGSTPPNSRNQPPAQRQVGADSNTRPEHHDRGSAASRVLAVGALVAVALLVTVLLLGGRQQPQVQAAVPDRRPAGQGQPGPDRGQPGRLGRLDRPDRGQPGRGRRSASTRPLHEGTTAVIRATSLSGVANHYVSLTPGANNAPTLPDDAKLDRCLDDDARRPRPALRHLQRRRPARGCASSSRASPTIYVGKGAAGQRRPTSTSLPALNSTDRLLRGAELATRAC